MTWSFACAVTGGGRGLRVTRGGHPVAEVAFGLPGDPVEGWEADATEARLTRAGDVTARLRHLPDDQGWTSVLSLDLHAAVEQRLPPLGMAVTVTPGWAGWSWTSDVEGFMAVAPLDAAGPVLVVRVVHGFWRAASAHPVFTAEQRRAEGLGDGVAAFHLAHPTGSLRAFGRHQTTLEFSEVAGIDEVAGLVPGWLPDVVADAGDEVRFDLPDVAIVPGPGVQAETQDTVTVLRGEAGHREVAIHQVRGVQRLQLSFAPAVAAHLAVLATALKSRRPSAVPSAMGALVAAALERRAVLDAEGTLDWLEREDWLARGDLFGVATATVLAVETLDEALLEAACASVAAAPVEPGLGIVAMRCWLATLRLGQPPLDLSAILGRLATGGVWESVEAAALAGSPEPSIMAGLPHLFGAGILPGQPVGLSEADAGVRAAVLRLAPEGWPHRIAASRAATRAASLLWSDHADGLHPGYSGLAWLLLGDLHT